MDGGTACAVVTLVGILGCLVCLAPPSSYYVTSPSETVLQEVFGPIGIVRIPITSGLIHG